MRILAYFLVLLLGPTIASLVRFVTLPVLISLGRLRTQRLIANVAISVVEGALVVWVGIKIFSWLDQRPTAFIAVALGISYFLNDFRRVKASAGTDTLSYEVTGMSGDLAGIVVGGLLFLT